MSKLIDNLDKISKGSPTPMGFGVVRSQEKLPPFLLIGLLSDNLASYTSKKAEGLWDALLIKSPIKTLKTSSISKVLSKITWGAWPTKLAAKDTDALRKHGCDFLVFPIEGATLEALEEGDVARILEVPLGMDDHLLRTLDDLPVDAVLISLAGHCSSPLTLWNLMQISVIRTMTSRYMLLDCPIVPDRRELETLRDSGIDALVLDATTLPSAALERVRADLLALPDRKRKSDSAVATIPQLRGQAARPEGEEEWEEEDEDS